MTTTSVPAWLDHAGNCGQWVAVFTDNDRVYPFTGDPKRDWTLTDVDADGIEITSARYGKVRISNPTRINVIPLNGTEFRR